MGITRGYLTKSPDPNYELLDLGALGIGMLGRNVRIDKGTRAQVSSS